MEKTFLVEIGTEELPAKSLKFLAISFLKSFEVQLKNTNLIYDKILWYASSRRLALKIFGIKKNRNKIKSNKNILKIKSKNGKNLILNKIQSPINNIYKKREYTKKILFNILDKVIHNLPISNQMRWGENQEKFIRPVHTLTMLLDTKIVHGKLFNITSKRIIYGNRFIGNKKIVINSAKEYPSILQDKGKVIADYETRKKLIKEKANNLVLNFNGNIKFSNNLLEEITAIVEWPVALIAKFKKKFLKIPEEILIYIIQNIQKCFLIYTKENQITHYFVLITNIKSSNPKKIITKTEMVVNSKLKDVEFFLQEDCKKKLEEYQAQLQTIIFEKKLGTLLDKTNRLKKLSKWIAKKIKANPERAIRAAILSKCDLTTKMIFEFPGIEGIIGMYYAKKNKEPEDISIAIKEHYRPKFLNDKLPSNKIGDALSISDKIDTLVGLIGIKKIPSGTKDPFALRRAANGILQIIIKNNYDINLINLIKKSKKLYKTKLINTNTIENCITFIFNRLYSIYQTKGCKTSHIQAVLNKSETNLINFHLKVKAISYFCSLKISEKIITNSKRILKILEKSDEKLNQNIDSKLLKKTEEIHLKNHLDASQNKLNKYLSRKDYKSFLIELDSFEKYIVNFFKKIMIMEKNKSIRINRLTLLKKVYNLFCKIANLSLL